jgi:integrase
VASIHAQKNRTGNTYWALWRADGRQRSLTFENLPSAERFKTLLEDHGRTRRCASSNSTWL